MRRITESNAQSEVLTEDFWLPGTDIILEKGDRIRVIDKTSTKVRRTVPIVEARLTKSETDILVRFLADPSSTIDITSYKGIGRVRGGGSATGKRDYDAAKKLADKGIVEIISKRADSYNAILTVKLKDRTILNSLEVPVDVRVMAYRVAKFLFDSEHSPRPIFFGGSRNISQADQKYFSQAQLFGLIPDRASILSPELTTKGFAVAQEEARIYDASDEMVDWIADRAR